MDVYQAANVEEAVEMATRFREEGRYNWFRGQVQSWPPYSSLFRVNHGDDTDLQKRAQRRIEMFLGWLSQTPQLQSLLANVDSAGIVAQHYGIPTNYIDFSTEPGVAGFFAADSPVAYKDGEPGCIYCVNTDELMDVWETMREFRPGASMELINSDVSNLWRLESQHGCFLFCDYNWDVDFPMDRILFPQSSYPSWPTREIIYPPQKSPLELLIDQYFDVEQKTFGSEWLREQFQKRQAEGAQFFWHDDDEAYTQGYREGALRGTEIQPAASWEAAKLKAWTGFATEKMEETLGAPVTLQVKMESSSTELAKSVTYGVRQLLNSRKRARQLLFSWQLRGLTLTAPLSLETLSSALESVWNGMRSLPYSDEEIAIAFGVTTQLYVEGITNNNELATAKRVFGDCFQVEFAAHDGSSSRGYVRVDSIRKAFRADLASVASDELLEKAQSDVRSVLTWIFYPNLLLEFEQLQKIFSHEVIPTQVLTRKLVLYSPAQLWTFGLP